MAVSFNGGMTIFGRKHSKAFESKPLLPCAEHVFVLNEHEGAAILPVVEEGEYVAVGDKLADAEEYTALPVHSSISGYVEKIEFDEKGQALSIHIRNDKLYTISEKIVRNIDYDKLTDRERLWIIRDAGIMDMDRVPAHLKLAPEKEIKYLVVNGVESDPHASSKFRRMLENAEEVVRGIRAAKELIKADQCLIGIESGMGDVNNAIKPFIRYDSSYGIITVKRRFPQDNNKILIKTLTGITVRLGTTEADNGVVCMDIETLYNIGRVFTDGMPVTERIVSIWGSALRDADNFSAPIGVSADFLFSAAGGFKEPPKLIARGSVFDGEAIISARTPVTKTSAAFFALKDCEQYDEINCIYCGRCAKICPMRLLPHRLSRCAVKNDSNGMVKYHAWDCIECGLCTYVCPSRIDILGNIRRMSAARKEAAANE